MKKLIYNFLEIFLVKYFQVTLPVGVIILIILISWCLL